MKVYEKMSTLTGLLQRQFLNNPLSFCLTIFGSINTRLQVEYMFKITAITLISYAVVYRCMVTDSTSTHLIQLKRIRMTAIERNTTSSHNLYEYMFNKLASNFLSEDHSNKHYYILNGMKSLVVLAWYLYLIFHCITYLLLYEGLSQ